MLLSLHIENIAVIEKADVDFGPGFTVLTGETGAGKSILIDSINAVLGERTSRELIRQGCEKAVVSAEFGDLSKELTQKLKELGYTSDEDTLVITRLLSEQKSAAKINGMPATASILREIAPLLINIHGQHDSQALLNPEKHVLYIDLLAKNESLLAEYGAAFSDMQKTRKQIKELTQNTQEKERRMEMLRYQIQEIEQAELKPGEQQRLLQRRDAINHAQTIAEALQRAYYAISGEDDETKGALERIDGAFADITQISRYDPQASAISDQIADAKYQLEDVRGKIEDLMEQTEFDPGELETVEQRLDLLYRLFQKYGENEQAVLDFYQKAKDELDSIVLQDAQLGKLHTTLASQVERVKTLGGRLTQSRKKAGAQFAKDVAAQLAFLNMPGVKIAVSVEPAAYSRHGADKVEFLISTNPGEPLKSLIKIASGGEMSRIMLAIKNVLSSDDPVGTLIFDEIDTGISGSAAQKVGIKLKETANGKQVICVTHLAQIAALAQTHLLIEKDIQKGRAVTRITPLDFDGRRRELARIIGSAVTEANLKSAEEMLHLAGMNP